MSNNISKSDKRRSSALRLLSVLCFIVAVALVVLTFFMMLPQVQRNLDRVQVYFNNVEMFIAGLNHFWAFSVILLLFVLKAFVPVVPISVLFIASGLVFPIPFAAVLNVVGFAIWNSIKFLWGKKYGGGNAQKILKKYNKVNDFMKLGSEGNRWMLVVLRFVPFTPVGTVSRLYGATCMKLLPFVSLSVLGFLPRIISWSVIGCNITNPFTPAFTTPFVALLVISGVSLLVLDTFIKIIKKDKSERKLNHE